MKKFLIAMVSAAMIFFGCGDDSSSSSGPNDESGVESSSSVEQGSSSSEKAKSSSSNAQSEVKQSSSSEKTGKSSSSVDDASSSSGKSESSSSVENSQSNSGVMTSSSSATSSSSVEEPKSSSSEIESSSSSSEGSEPVERSSSSSLGDVNCSVLLEGETGWSWNVPKECRFNSEITYGTMTDERDGKTYKTVKIGDQTWMAENLNYYDATNLSVKEKSWCFGKKDNEDSTTCDVAGRFYTWAAAIDSMKLANDADNPLDCGDGMTCTLPDTVYGICPSDWHLPTLAEWKALFEAVGGRSVAAGVLKSQNGWYSKGNGTDAVGFSAIPVGFRTRAGDYDFEGYFAHFWSASESDEDNAYDVFMNYYIKDVRYDDDVKFYGYSVRCVKNE